MRKDKICIYLDFAKICTESSSGRWVLGKVSLWLSWPGKIPFLCPLLLIGSDSLVLRPAGSASLGNSLWMQKFRLHPDHRTDPRGESSNNLCFNRPSRSIEFMWKSVNHYNSLAIWMSLCSGYNSSIEEYVFSVRQLLNANWLLILLLIGTPMCPC